MRHGLQLYGRVLSWLVNVEIVASIIALATVCIVTLAAIVARELLNSSLLWAEEISILLMKVVVFQGAAGIYARRAYIVVDGLTARFSPRAQWLVSLFGWLLIAVFAAIACREGILTYRSQMAVRSYLLELPRFYFTVPLILGTATIALVSLYYLLATLHAGPAKTGTDIDRHVPGLKGTGRAA